MVACERLGTKGTKNTIDIPQLVSNQYRERKDMNQRMTIILRVVWLPVLLKQSFSLRVSTDLSARFKCPVAEGGIRPLNNNISFSSRVLDEY